MDRSKRSAGAAAGGFPDDPLVEILSRVPAKSVFRFRCVCKAWRDLIDDPLNRRKLPQTLQGFFVTRGDVGVSDFINFSARPPVPLDIDPRFSFLTKLPEIGSLFYEDSCNGLLLFEHYRKLRQDHGFRGYIVCNPATKHWGTVPRCGCRHPSTANSTGKTFLAFDPAVSSHFHLIQFLKKQSWDNGVPLENRNPLMYVHAYSSETGTWSHSDEQGQLEGWRHQGDLYVPLQQAFVNGVLHSIVTDFSEAQMVAVDVQGKTKRMITMPAAAKGKSWANYPFIGQSQGRLHYINHDFGARDLFMQSYELSIWILKDYDTQEWLLKDTVSFLNLFGRMRASRYDFDIAAIHPDCNVVFIQQPNILIAYDMDSKEVSVVVCLEDIEYVKIAPYIPYFSESPALTDN